MSTLRNPVGSQPPSVYWRRRLFVLLGLAAVVAIIVLIIVRPGSGQEGRETPSPTPTTSGAASAPPAEAGGSCNPAVLVIEPVLDKTTYQAGEQPQVSVRVTNTGSAACTLTVGVDQLVFSIVSGSDPIWTSSDCLTTPEFELELQPGQPISNAPIAWDRTRSAPDTCSSSRPAVIAGGATYRLSVAIGSVESEADLPFLLY